ncbi:hypothetical protein [Hoeflea sp. EC-HK425]|uniref:hypothetical protein n=1 Tax=Hoeflea sp. EC-HK425 TaxID=2038388 RepID=UPI0012518C4B|nr:hypothetical protein [Hoeflea sp. EC-HK425]VVT28133.1 conserved hypothetical protein [Hoeflea sp. EC-HK425]
MNKTTPLTHGGYQAGHPWYYYLGGRIPRLKEIRDAVIQSGYRGYMAERIDTLEALPEPRRSEKLRTLRDDVRAELYRDIRRYRVVARALRSYRHEQATTSPGHSCDDVHTAMSLKYAHIYNGLAHLHVLDALLGKQPDLFAL